MKTFRILTKSFFYIFLVSIVFIFSSVIYLDYNINKNFKIKSGSNINIDSFLPVTAVYNGTELSQSGLTRNIGEEYSVDLKLFGVIPVSKANVQVIDEMYVSLLGQPFGMKLYTEGVLVIKTGDVQTENGNVNPSKDAGLKIGDYILSVNGEKISTNEDLSKIVENSNGEKLNFIIKRKNKKLNLKIKAKICKETEKYKIGIWVRDSSAGVGMLTFYSPSNDIICGLGHGICDEDTGSLLHLDSGEMVTADIISAVKGEKGSPGQLKGRFGFKTLGDINLNSNMGVYSLYKGNINTDRLVEVALKNEISSGEAVIFCTVEGSEPKEYSCEVELRASAYMSKTQNMVVTVTDNELLNKTGGIVQGMSGSPLIQNGKLIGAVTHVLVDDPTRGYAIFAENMLETAQSVAENNKLKDAS